MSPNPKSRIIAKKGKVFVPLQVKDIAICYSYKKVSFVQLFEGSKFIVTNNLTELNGMLSPAEFFRTNRSTIVNINAIKEYSCSSTGKISVELTPAKLRYQSVSVSQLSARGFRQWIESH
jgi:DNA-binding LytR/AlgR family response regulator